VFVLESELVLNLLEFGLYPWISFVAVSVEFGEIAKSLFDVTVVDQPSRGLWEQEDKRSEEYGGNDLDTKTGTPLTVVVVSKSGKSACSC
jgi:hypothetical protein